MHLSVVYTVLYYANAHGQKPPLTLEHGECLHRYLLQEHCGAIISYNKDNGIVIRLAEVLFISFKLP